MSAVKPLQWGFPQQVVYIRPAEGELVMWDGSPFTVIILEEHELTITPGRVTELGDDHEHIRIHGPWTGDGLSICRNRTERDGYRMDLTKDGWPGQREWRIERGES